MPKLYGAAAKAHAKKQKKAAKKRGAKKRAAPARKRAAPAKQSAGFLRGYHDGHGDVKASRPLRKVRAGTRDPYARGYRAGVREARHEGHHRKS